MISSIISRVVILVCGNLYPAYASYKAVKTKNVKEYVKWMMYWIVFALFTCTETFTDIFLSWFPFYYEIKIILVIWLLSPATRGSSFLYRKFVHPMLSRREQEIDEYINRAKEQSYRQVLDLGQKGVTVLMQTAIKGGGGLVNQLKKSYSLSDLSGIGSELARVTNRSDEVDDSVGDIRVVRRRTQKERRSPHRSSSASASAVYFSEVDINVLTTGCPIGEEIRSTEDISSGYSSGEFSRRQTQSLNEEAVSGLTGRRSQTSMKARPTRVTRSSSRSNVPSKKRDSISDDSEDEDELFDTNIVFFNDKAKHIRKLVDNYEKLSKSDSDNEQRNDPFFDTRDFPSSSQHDVLKNNFRTTACAPPVLKCGDFPNSFLPESGRNFDVEKIPKEKLITEAKQVTSDPVKLINTDQVGGDSEKRGGKYHKKTAPLPPPAAIKATLILQPGVVRQYLSKSAEDISSKELFLRTARVKRSRSRSPANSTGSNNSTKLQKFLKFPKKMNDTLKRKSWGDFFMGKKMSDVAVRNAKSTSNLPRISLNDSTHRRLKIIKNYVDQDID